MAGWGVGVSVAVGSGVGVNVAVGDGVAEGVGVATKGNFAVLLQARANIEQVTSRPAGPRRRVFQRFIYTAYTG